MDGKAQPISSSDLYAHLGTDSAPLLLDVRRDQAFSEDGLIIARCAVLRQRSNHDRSRRAHDCDRRS